MNTGNAKRILSLKKLKIDVNLQEGFLVNFHLSKLKILFDSCSLIDANHFQILFSINTDR